MAKNRIRRIQRNLRLTKPIVILAAGVLAPVLLSTSVGIIALALGKSSLELILGVLWISLAAATVGSGVIVTVLLGRRARTARLQSDLLGNVSHDIKTPLAAIRMYAQTLQMGLVDRDTELTGKCVESIVRESEWLGVMIERLLTWRMAARDRDNLDLVTGPIDKLAEDAAVRFRRMLPPGEAAFQVKIDTRLPVNHDPNGVHSVIINLLTNAFKYTGEKKEISLSVKDLEDRVEIVVADNGVGIPPNEVKRIFEPFHRSEPGSGRGATGSGLGLAIVDFMVKAHSGTILVESSVGEWSRFTVTLPVAVGEETGP